MNEPSTPSESLVSQDEELPSVPKQPRDSIVKPFWEQVSTTALIRFLLLFACGWAFITLLAYFETAIFTFTIAAILAFLLKYPLNYLSRFLGRGAALPLMILLTLVIVVVAIASLGLTISGQLQQLVSTIIADLNSPDNIAVQLENWLNARNIRIDLEPIAEQARRSITSALSFAALSLPSVFGSFFNFIFIIVIAFFMLTDGERLWRLILKTLPSRHRERFSSVIHRNFVGFVQGQLLVAFFLGVLSLIVFWIFQIPFALALSLIVAGFDLLPGIGATLGVTIACLIILVQSGWVTALKVLAICIVLQQIQDNYLAPRIMKNTVNLNPIVIFLAIFIGGRIAGILGVFLSIPIAGIIVSLLGIEEMQSSE